MLTKEINYYQVKSRNIIKYKHFKGVKFLFLYQDRLYAFFIGL